MACGRCAETDWDVFHEKAPDCKAAKAACPYLPSSTGVGCQSPSLPFALSRSPFWARCMRGFHRCGAALSTTASKAHDVTTQSPTTGGETPTPILRAFFSYLSGFFPPCLVPLGGRPAQGLIVRFAHPEAVQHHGQLPSHGDHGSFLTALAATLGQPQPKSSQVAVLPERT